MVIALAVGSPQYHWLLGQGWGQGEDQALIHCWIDRIDRLSGLVFAIDVDKQIDGVKLVLF